MVLSLILILLNRNVFLMYLGNNGTQSFCKDGLKLLLKAFCAIRNKSIFVIPVESDCDLDFKQKVLYTRKN